MPFVSHAQNFEDVMLHRALRDIQIGFYIDIGANDPELHSVTFAFYERGWRGVNVEPVETDRARLAAKRPRDTTLGVAVGEKPGFLPFYVFPGTGLSTLSRAKPRSTSLRGCRCMNVSLKSRPLRTSAANGYREMFIF